MGKRKTHEEFLAELYAKRTDIEVLEKYIGVKQKIKCKCKKCNNEWYVTPDNLLSGRGCPMCRDKKLANDRIKSLNQFVSDLYIINPGIEIIGDYSGARKNIKCKCKICNYKWNALPTNLLKGKGCPNCKAMKTKERCTKSHEDFIHEMKDINSDIKIISKYLHSHSKVKCQCLKCNNIWESQASSLLCGVGCPQCNISKGENSIINYLESRNIIYERQKKFNKLIGIGKRHLSYDFYLPCANLLIEYNGRQHYEAIDVFGGEKYFEIQQEHDKRKREYANNNKFILLEIPHWKYDDITNILDTYLQEVS